MTVFQSSRFRLAALLLATPLIFASCKKDKEQPMPDDDNEQITTVTYTLTPVGGGTAATVTWRDLDGTGGNAPTIGTLNLQRNTTYNGTITLLDETKNPIVNTSTEIANEKDEHLFVYTPTPASLLAITRTDADSKGLPVGLTTRLVTNATTTGNGSLLVTLRHQPGTKDGTAGPGDTDVEVSFPVVVQ